jgi:tetratricopeptide (TPR) repeat protein
MSRIPELESLLEENPEDPFIIYALAREYEKESGTMQAFLMYEHLVTNHPEYIATYYHYAKLLHSLGNLNEAFRLLEKGIEQGILEKDMHAVSEMKGLLDGWRDRDDD